MYYANWIYCKLNIVLREFEAYNNLRAKSLFSKAFIVLEVMAPTLTTMETWLGQFLMHASTELTMEGNSGVFTVVSKDFLFPF